MAFLIIIIIITIIKICLITCYSSAYVLLAVIQTLLPTHSGSFLPKTHYCNTRKVLQPPPPKKKDCDCFIISSNNTESYVQY